MAGQGFGSVPAWYSVKVSTIHLSLIRHLDNVRRVRQSNGKWRYYATLGHYSDVTEAKAKASQWKGTYLKAEVVRL